MKEVFSDTVTALKVIPNMPAGNKVAIQTNADLAVAFWNPAAGDYAATEAVSAPGARFHCPNSKARITTATTAEVTITILN